jgi:hypothetical protein
MTLLSFTTVVTAQLIPIDDVKKDIASCDLIVVSRPELAQDSIRFRVVETLKGNYNPERLNAQPGYLPVEIRLDPEPKGPECGARIQWDSLLKGDTDVMFFFNTHKPVSSKGRVSEDRMLIFKEGKSTLFERTQSVGLIGRPFSLEDIKLMIRSLNNADQ